MVIRIALSLRILARISKDSSFPSISDSTFALALSQSNLNSISFMWRLRLRAVRNSRRHLPPTVSCGVAFSVLTTDFLCLRPEDKMAIATRQKKTKESLFIRKISSFNFLFQQRLLSTRFLRVLPEL